MKKKIIVAIPHSHAWFWLQTCVSSLARNPPVADGYDIKIVVVDNSPWSPSIRGLTDTKLWEDHCHRDTGLTIIPNHKSNKFHASALDCIVDDYEFDYLMALETDLMALRPDWLEWFLSMMRPTDYAVGMWHHEQFINPSCTLYRGDVLRDMARWCQSNKSDVLRWGPLFDKSQPLDDRTCDPKVVKEYISWVAGPFAEKRGWLAGTVLKEQPSGQLKGPGWYEPGQQLHHFAVEGGYTYTVCPSLTTTVDNVPVQTMYGSWGENELADGNAKFADRPHARMGCGERGCDHKRQLEAVEMFGNAQTVHLWGGTRALDIIKHDVTCEFVKKCTPGWLAREARFWKAVVPQDVQLHTLALIRKYGFHYTGQGTDHISDRDRAAAEFVKQCYAVGGVTW